MRNWKFKIFAIISTSALAALIVLFTTHSELLTTFAQNFSGPGCSAGSCSGRVGTTATSTLLITSTSTSNYAITASGTIFSTNGGYKFPDNSIQTTAYLGGGGLASTSAPNVSAGQFGANTGGGNFSFPSAVSIGTTTAPAGVSLFIGATNPTSDTFESVGVDAANGPAFNFGYAGASFGRGAGFFNARPDASAVAPNPSIRFGTANVQRMIIDNAGNVGIGTSTPASKLHVLTGNVDGLRVESSNSGYLEVGKTSGTRWRLANDYNSSGVLELLVGTNGSAPASNVLTVSSTNGTVGIGSGPVNGSKLSVGGDIYVTAGGNLSFQGVNNNNGLWWYAVNNSAWGSIFRDTATGNLHINSQGTFLFGVEQGTNVGIGTSTPAAKLHVVGTSQNTLALDSPAYPELTFRVNNVVKSYIGQVTSAGGYFTGSTAGDTVIRNDASGAIRFGHGSGSADFSILSNAHVLIATTSDNGGLLNVGTSTSGLVATFGGGSGKINVGTVDPIYTIGGERYATYLSGMTGQKEETAGTISCELRAETCEHVIDFNNLEKGSDLWLFGKATDIKKHFADMTVLLTPAFDGKAWYEKDAANLQLIIHASPLAALSSPLEISYRLTAPRFDSASWPNTSDVPYMGFNLDALSQ